MGSWGNGSFQNDDALDWVWLLDDDQDGAVPLEALRLVAEAAPDEYVEAPVCARALAAAELVAAARDRAVPDLPPEVSAWVERHREHVTPELRDFAVRAVARVRDNSELRDLWHEGPGYHAWFGQIAVLESRLDNPGKLMKQIVATHQTWKVLATNGVREGASLQVDFFYAESTEGAAEELAAFLREETDYEVRVASSRKGLLGKTWHVEGTTKPMTVDLGRLSQWVTWMFVAGEEHGQCELDGWGAPVPQP